MAEAGRSSLTLLERFQALDGLLPVLAGALDIRETFSRIAEICRPVIPHDMAALIVVSTDRQSVTLHAVSGGSLRPSATAAIPDSLRSWLTEPWSIKIFDDLQADAETRDGLSARAGLRAAVRIAVRDQSELVAILEFSALAPGIYGAEEGLMARRVGDHVALALSHYRLAEEAQRAAEARERAALLERRVTALTAEVDALGAHRRVVGESAAWKQVLRQAAQVSATDTTVLLVGESGTGKEVVARFIHRASARSGGPFVAINCAALPEQLLESELFGHERGAFTGAHSPRPGQLEVAAAGVLFLDEVTEMSLTAQAKFLRVLQEREFKRLGGARVLKANVRVIAATNRDLAAAVARGAFREDLYYRLAVFEIRLPSLRERLEDVLPLSEVFLHDIARSFGRPPAGISRDARQRLVEYSWPGNVRQLRNALERAAIVSEGGLITSAHLALPERIAPPLGTRNDDSSAAQPAPNGGAASEGGASELDLRTLERAAIEKALRDSRFNKSKAARILGLTRTQLYVRLRKHGLE